MCVSGGVVRLVPICTVIDLDNHVGNRVRVIVLGRIDHLVFDHARIYRQIVPGAVHHQRLVYVSDEPLDLEAIAASGFTRIPVIEGDEITLQSGIAIKFYLKVLSTIPEDIVVVGKSTSIEVKFEFIDEHVQKY